MKRAGIPDDEIHALANITVLNERTNANKLAGLKPSVYIRRFGISEQDLLGHLIPSSFARAAQSPDLLETQWSVERYVDFLVERAQLLAQEANAFLKDLEKDQS